MGLLYLYFTGVIKRFNKEQCSESKKIKLFAMDEEREVTIIMIDA